MALELYLLSDRRVFLGSCCLGDRFSSQLLRRGAWILIAKWLSLRFLKTFLSIEVCFYLHHLILGYVDACLMILELLLSLKHLSALRMGALEFILILNSIIMIMDFLCRDE